MALERLTVQTISEAISTESNHNQSNGSENGQALAFTLNELLRMREEFLKIQMKLYKAQELVESSSIKMDHILELIGEAIQRHPDSKLASENDQDDQVVSGVETDDELR